jgi:hypothetical protein
MKVDAVMLLLGKDRTKASWKTANADGAAQCEQLRHAPFGLKTYFLSENFGLGIAEALHE